MQDAHNLPGNASGDFQDGDPATNAEGTKLLSVFINDLMKNIMKVLENAGISPTDDREEDLYDAIKATTPTDFLVKHNVGGDHKDDVITKAHINADVAGTGLVQDGDGSLKTNPDNTTLENSGDQLRVKNSDPVAFSVHKNGTDQSFPYGVITKVTWSTEEFDTNGNFASDKFTPQVAGKYYLECTIRWETISADKYCNLWIYKNGAQYKETRLEDRGGGGFWTKNHHISALVEANGSTDYFEIYARNMDSMEAQVVSGSSMYTYFHGFRLPFS